jgi:hypothetical protein
MRQRKRRTEIAFELEQILVVRRRCGSVSGWCSGCAGDVVMLTPDEAASTTAATTRGLYRMVDAGVIHFTETESGLIRLWLPSLLQALSAASQSHKELLS